MLKVLLTLYKSNRIENKEGRINAIKHLRANTPLMLRGALEVRKAMANSWREGLSAYEYWTRN